MHPATVKRLNSRLPRTGQLRPWLAVSYDSSPTACPCMFQLPYHNENRLLCDARAFRQAHARKHQVHFLCRMVCIRSVMVWVKIDDYAVGIDRRSHSRGEKFARALRNRCPSDPKGRRECRVLHAPIASYANKKAYECSHHRYARGNPAFPARLVLTVSFVISPVIGLSCHRRLADISTRLDAGVEASGPHDFAVRSTRRSSGATPASIASRTQRS
jgi:hypothetical protein